MKAVETPKTTPSKLKGHKSVRTLTPATLPSIITKSPKKMIVVSKAIVTKDTAFESSISEDVATTKDVDHAPIATKSKKITKSLDSKSKKSQLSVATSPETISTTSVKEATAPVKKVIAPPSIAPTPKKSTTTSTSETKEDPSMVLENELSDILEKNIPED
ncbi:hypothetical protein PanWU01x14_184300 [Parasponia andersonii]|uniref:Uncharacterized protein n=1 Tax=Parasponia andersonii TaxID=3476 RepID=A0A2P5C4I1_PARAD|nr:hypothetical protein PanWU01x14_184300 [Parasponia andersonii]